MAGDRQARIDEAVDGFRRACAAGGGPTAKEWAGRFPDLAPELEAALRRAASDSDQDHTQTHANSGEPSLDGVRLKRLWNVVLDAGQPDAPGALGEVSPDADETNRAGNSRPPRALPHIDGYDFARELHRGGQGVVYQALEKATKRKVAIKVLLEGPYASDQARKRFEREIELAASLKHPNIVPVFHSGLTADGRQFCVMDYVRGVPLHEYVRDQKLGMEAALRLFSKVCDAVNYAHQKGVIHRDLKPSNILVDADGSPKVLDFGLAKQIGGPEQTLVSMTGQVVGTLPYMSPEQVRGNPDEIDIRTDVYSLGVVLYEMLTGRYPYPVVGQIAEVLRHITATEPTPPGRAWDAESGVSGGRRTERGRSTVAAWLRRLPAGNPGVSPIDDEVQTIVLRALTKERQRRYQSAAELAADIDRYLKDEPIEAKKDSTLYVLGKQLKRYRVPVVVAIAFVLTLLAGLAGTVWQARRANERAADATRAEGLARAATEEQRRLAESEAAARRRADAKTAEAEAARERVERSAYLANVDMASSALESRQFDRVRARLNACPPRLRGWEWRWLNAVTDNSLVALKDHTNVVKSAAYSRDGSRIVTASLDDTARIWDVASGRCLRVLKGHTHSVFSAEFSPDGRRIATASADKTARIWDAATGATLMQLKGHTDEVNGAYFSPDGRHVLTVAVDPTPRLWDGATGNLIAEMKGHTEGINSAAFSPDGTRIATASYDATVRLWDATTGAYLTRLDGHTGIVMVDEHSFSPDSRRIVTASSMKSSKELDSTVRVWDAVSGAGLVELKGHTAGVLIAGFSPDGKRIVTASVDKTAKIWDAETGEARVQLDGHTGMVTCAVFSPDGQSVLTGSQDQAVRLWNASTGLLNVELLGTTNVVMTAQFSPDGMRVNATSLDNSARIWGVGPDAMVTRLRGHDGHVHYAAFSPDGNRVVTASSDKTARVWDVSMATPLAELKGHANLLYSAVFSPDGLRILTASPDGTARIWDAATGTSITELRGHSAGVNYAAYSADGTRVVTASADSTARVWDAATGVVVQSFEGHVGEVLTAEFSPDGSQIVTTSDLGIARIWDVASGTTVMQIRGHDDSVNYAAFSEDGRRIVTASSDKTARIWSAATGETLLTLKGHTEMVTCASFSPDGSRIMTASADSTARIWDSETGASVLELKGHSFMHYLDTAMFSKDGTRVVSASRDATARIWDSIPHRVRYAERQRRERGETNVDLVARHVNEIGGTAPATWLSDPALEAERPDLGAAAHRPATQPAY